MSDPSKYTKGYDFGAFQRANPTTPLPAPQVDGELINVAASIGELADAMRDVRRSDGALKNAIVTPDSLSASARAMLSGIGELRGPWVSGATYATKDGVSFEGATYIAVSGHMAGAAFSADLNAGLWLLLSTPYSLSGAVFNQMFSGDGETTVFGLSQPFNTISELSVYVQDGAGGYQRLRAFGDDPQVSLLSQTSLSFASAPGEGVGNVLVEAVNQASAASSAAAGASAIEAAESAAQAEEHKTEAGDYALAASEAAALAAGDVTATLEGYVGLAQTATSQAQAARDVTLDALDHFDDRYLGAKANDPLIDNDGDPLVGGALYFRTSDPVGMRVYTGATWVAAYVSGSVGIPTVAVSGNMVTGSAHLGACLASGAGKEIKLHVPLAGEVGGWILILSVSATLPTTITKASGATAYSAHGTAPFTLPPYGAVWARVIAAGIWVVEGTGLAAAAIAALQVSDARNQRAARIVFNSISR